MSDEAPIGLAVQVSRGHASEEELAALIAVVTESYSSEVAGALAESGTPTAWSRTQRPLRAPLRRDIPFGRFAG